MFLPKSPNALTVPNVISRRAIACLAFSCVFTASVHARSVSNEQLSSPVNKLPPQTINVVKPDFKILQPRIQVAILLDTSGSMDGLIDQTRNQLWQVVNEFSTIKRNGQTPILEVALFDYGNDGNQKSSGYVRQLTGFTRELDKVSEGLFSLTTNGGSEYCGHAIKTAVESLQWSRSANDIKTIFIAGNEPFTQGPVNYQHAIALAKQQGVSVNTIFAGDHQRGTSNGWLAGAELAGGDYMSIDANRQIAHVKAPQDQRIAELNAQLNQTYVPYGSLGEVSVERQMEQDKLSSNISSGLLAKRARSKSSDLYNNNTWDLVDAVNDGKVKDDELVDMEVASLPKAMRKLPAEKRKAYVLEKAEERQKIKQEISLLSKKRDEFIAEKEQESTSPSVSTALTESIMKQAKEKKFTVEKKTPNSGLK